MKKNKQNYIYISVLTLISVLVAIYCQLPAFQSYYSLFKDANQFLMPIMAFKYNPLLQESIMVKYITEVYPIGYLNYLKILSCFIDPVWLVKILPIFLTILTSIFLYKIGQSSSSHIMGFFMGYIGLLHFWTFQTFTGATPRSFALPILCIFLYYIYIEHYLIAGFLLILATLFYPTTALIAIFIYILSCFKYDNQIRLICRNSVKKIVLMLLLCFLLILLIYLIPDKEVAVNAFNFNQMRNMEEFYIFGKEPFFFNNAMGWLKSGHSGINLNITLTTLFYLSLISIVILKKKTFSIPKQIWQMMIISTILFFISFPLSLKLYYPNRFVIFSLPLFLITIISLMLSKIIASISSIKKGICCLVLICLVITGFYFPSLNGMLQNNESSKELFIFLKTLPNDTMIAAHPYISEPIPTFAHRKVFINHRLNLPWHSTYYKKIKKRNLDFFEAYYSDSVDTILRFCQKYNINYLIIDITHFGIDYIEAKKFYLSPFNDYIITQVKNKNNFAIFELINERCVFDDGKILVLKMK